MRCVEGGRTCPLAHHSIKLILALAALTGFVACSQSGEPSDEAATYVGGAACQTCHPDEAERWTGSHHDLAMQPADESTVLADFNGSTFTHGGVTSEFYRRDGRFFVKTDGPDGRIQEFSVSYTFGVDPLQQYLVEFPGGRFQVLSICWDSRPREQGGQRWFHLYPDESIPFDDELHWTGINQNWNYMCAECHSTNLQKNYDPVERRYSTSWSEIDVSCESCHGPGSNHVLWAESDPQDPGEAGAAEMGLPVAFDRSTWVLDEGSPTARRTEVRRSHTEIETCARCHSRRAALSGDYRHGRPLMDTHLPSLPVVPLYHVDGQIREEVYVYGSFLQSRMYQSGVSCSDCHESHSMRVFSEGNDLCARCHVPGVFDSPRHHFHAEKSAGTSCIECHMPARNFMVVDPRRDHSMRIPRPDLSVKLGTPNACTDCHSDKPFEWAADAASEWYGPARSSEPHLSEVLEAARSGAPGSHRILAGVVSDRSVANILRASALSAIVPNSDPGTLATIEAGLKDPDPLLRRTALTLLDGADAETLKELAFPLIRDSVRLVRIEAGRLVAALPEEQLTADEVARRQRVLEEYIAAQVFNAERPESHLNLGNLYMRLGDLERSEQAYQAALRLEPSFVPSYANLADLYRIQGREAESEEILRLGLKARDHPDLRHALGLQLVRQKKIAEAISELALAARVRPENARYSYVYAVALHSTGRVVEAIAVLEKGLKSSPNDLDILNALVTYLVQTGDRTRALEFARRMQAIRPEDPRLRDLVRNLQR